MTPSEKNIVRSLVAVAWVDGKLESGESSVIEGLAHGLRRERGRGEREILEYAKTRRTLENDIPLAELSSGDRELLLSNAALLTHADGSQSAKEKAVLKKLAEILGFSRRRGERHPRFGQRRRPAAERARARERRIARRGTKSGAGDAGLPLLNEGSDSRIRMVIFRRVVISRDSRGEMA